MFFITKALSNSYCQNLTGETQAKSDSLIVLTADELNKELSSSLVVTDTAQPINAPKKKKVLESEVKYHAKDSMRIEITSKKVFLYGEAEVEYETFKLKANYIELDFNLNTAYATGTLDSLGQLVGTPVFEEAGTSFNSKSMTYNFETKKGLIKEVITKQGDGYIHGEKVKKMDNEVMYIKHGKYTTCENPEPHFHLQVSKLKVIPNDKIVTGPAYLKIGDIPTPLALPFGFFPNKKGRASGIIPPAPGENQSLGFFLNNGGYYFGINDKVDLQLTADIYSKGSLAMRSKSHYVNKYHFNGSLEAAYSYIQTGFKELGNEPKKDFNVRWLHNQDAKANPNSSFSANVNVATSRYNKLNSPASTNYLNNTMQSNIAYGKSLMLLGLPSNLSLNASHSQNTINKSVSITLPQAVFNVNRFYPFKKKVQVGEEKPWEKIGISYVGNARNQVNTYDSLLFNNGYKQLNNGIQHGFVVSTSLKTNNTKWFKFLNYFTVTPSANYTDRWYLQTLNKKFDTQKDTIVTDTLLGFKRAGEYSFNNNITTKIYGMYQFNNSTIKAIRHVITPSFGFVYKPEINSQKTVINNNGSEVNYSPFDIGVFGKPNNIKQGNITYGIINNLEMKVRSKKDTITGFQKIKIFENLSINGSYNLLADTYKWSFIKLNARTNLFSNVDLVYNSTFDPYALRDDKLRINRLEWNVNKKLARLTDASAAINFRLNSKNKNNTSTNPGSLAAAPGTVNGYVDFNIPWTLNVYLNVNYIKPYKSNANQTINDPQFTQSLTFNGDFSLTPKWKIGFNSGYDFKLHDLSYTTINLYRDLHCWELRVDMTPMGLNKSYMISIGVKPGSLQDLKLKKQLRPDYSNF